MARGPRRLWVAASLLLASGGVWAQLEGCNSSDMQKISFVSRGLMGCVGVSLGEMLGFMRSLTGQQITWMNDCSADAKEHLDECLELVDSLTQMAASQANSVPAKVVNNVFNNPPQVVNCLAQLSSNLPESSFSPTCSDGKMMAQSLAGAARAAPFLNSISPWRLPPQLDGCSLPDMLSANLAALPVLECLNVNSSMLLDSLTTAQGGGSGSKQVEDATIRAAISCLYDPRASNSECFYIANLISVKLENMPFMGLDAYYTMAMTDFPQACRCTKGFSADANYQKISQQCSIRDVFKLLESLETTCKYQSSAQSALEAATKGCTDADIIRTEAVLLQVLDCIDADGQAVYSTAQVTDDVRIATVADCVKAPGTANKACISLVNSIGPIAASRPDSLEAKLVSKITGGDGANTCTCLDGAYKTSLAQAVKPNCTSAYTTIQLLRNNLDTCNLLTKTPTDAWSSVLVPPPPAPVPLPTPPPPPPTPASSQAPHTAAPKPAEEPSMVVIPPLFNNPVFPIKQPAASPPAPPTITTPNPTPAPAPIIPPIAPPVPSPPVAPSPPPTPQAHTPPPTPRGGNSYFKPIASATGHYFRRPTAKN